MGAASLVLMAGGFFALGWLGAYVRQVARAARVHRRTEIRAAVRRQVQAHREEMRAKRASDRALVEAVKAFRQSPPRA
jgi:hypothetical protein